VLLRSSAYLAEEHGDGEVPARGLAFEECSRAGRGVAAVTEMLAEAMIGALATALDFACRREHLSLTSRLQFSAGRLGGLQFWREFRPRQEQGSVGKRLEISDAILTSKATPPVARSAQMILMIAVCSGSSAATELAATASDEAVIAAAGAARVFGRDQQ